MIRYLLLRHFEVEPRYQGTYIGWTDAALSNGAEKEAQKLGERLHELEWTFDVVFSSDLQRCVRSLELMGFAPEKVTCLPELREKSFGRSEGMSFEEIQTRYGIPYVDFLDWIGAIGGESVEEFSQRVKKVFCEQIFTAPTTHAHVLVMTHAGVIRMIQSHLMQQPVESLFENRLGYGEMVCVCKDERGFEVLPDVKWEAI